VPVTSMAPKGPVPKGYTPLIGSEAWQSMIGKKRMTSVFYRLPHPQIRTSAFYHRPRIDNLILTQYVKSQIKRQISSTDRLSTLKEEQQLTKLIK